VYRLGGKNFINTMIKLAQNDKVIKVVSDQYGAPTSATFIAEITKSCITKSLRNNISGLFHLTPLGKISWYEFADYAISHIEKFDKNKLLNFNSSSFAKITSEEYKKEFQINIDRPKYSVLNTQKIISTFGVQISDWQEHVDIFINELLEKAPKN
jgi:dTDP-4-dehydrorhamnose reductase